jgi:hypothetical protein
MRQLLEVGFPSSIHSQQHCKKRVLLFWWWLLHRSSKPGKFPSNRRPSIQETVPSSKSLEGRCWCCCCCCCWCYEKKLVNLSGWFFRLLPNLANLTKVVQPLLFKFPHQRSSAQESQTKKPRGRRDCVRSSSEFLLLSTLWAHSWRSLKSESSLKWWWDRH